MNLRDHLIAVREKYGELKPEHIVDEARDPTHPLHSRFEWDNTVAGEAWRREQARKLLGEVEVSYARRDGSAGRLRAFYAVRRDNGHVYESLDELKNDPLSRELLMRDMRRDWEALRSRYQEFQEFWQLIEKETTDMARHG